MSRANKHNNAADAHHAVMREKYIALWAGVVFFAALIGLVWVVTVKQYIVAIAPPAGNNSAQQWESFLTDFQRGLAETKSSVEEVRQSFEEVQHGDGDVLGAQVTGAAESDYRRKRIQVEKVLYGMYTRLEPDTNK